MMRACDDDRLRRGADCRKVLAATAVPGRCRAEDRSAVRVLLSNEVSVSPFEHGAACLEDAKAGALETNADKVSASAISSHDDAQQIPRKQYRHDDTGDHADLGKKAAALHPPLFGEPQVGDVRPEHFLEVQ